MQLLVAAALILAATPKKQSFAPPPEPALQRPRSATPAPALKELPLEVRETEKLIHEKRLQMIRDLELLLLWTEPTRHDGA